MRVIICSSSNSYVEGIVFADSILSKSTKMEVSIFVADQKKLIDFKTGNETPVELPLGLSTKVSTDFSLARFLVGHLMGFEKYVIADSDMICIGDIEALDQYEDHGIYCTGEYWFGRYATSFMLVSGAEAAKFLHDTVMSIKGWSPSSNSELDITDVLYLTESCKERMKSNNVSLHCIPRSFNEFELPVQNSRIVHFTNLYTQPWRYHEHPMRDQWLQLAKRSVETGALKISAIEHQSELVTSFSREINAIDEATKKILLGNEPIKSSSERRSFLGRLKYLNDTHRFFGKKTLFYFFITGRFPRYIKSLMT